MWQVELFVAFSHSGNHECMNFASEVEPCTSGNRQVPNYPTFWLPNNTYTYQSSCYCCYNWAVQIIIRIFPLYMGCWFRVIRFLFSGGEAILSVTTVMLKDQETADQESSYLKKLMGWQTRGKEIHISWCRDTIGGLPHLGTIPQLQKYQDFWRISIQLKGILL